MSRMQALGVVINKNIPSKNRVNTLIDDLSELFMKDEVSKEDVIAVLKAYLPNFKHIETGKSLDSKM